jgi:predicted TPR repeat methyltransferase
VIVDVKEYADAKQVMRRHFGEKYDEGVTYVNADWSQPNAFKAVTIGDGFDLVVSYNVLHLLREESLGAFFDNCRDVVCKGGHMLHMFLSEKEPRNRNNHRLATVKRFAESAGLATPQGAEGDPQPQAGYCYVVECHPGEGRNGDLRDYPHVHQMSVIELVRGSA